MTELSKVKWGEPVPADHIAYMRAPEFLNILERDVAEPGQVTIANGLWASPPTAESPLSSLEWEELAKSVTPLSPDWERTASLWERGKEVCSAYGSLTHRGLIRWRIVQATQPWIVPDATEAGIEALRTRDR